MIGSDVTLHQCMDAFFRVTLHVFVSRNAGQPQSSENAELRVGTFGEGVPGAELKRRASSDMNGQRSPFEDGRVDQMSIAVPRQGGMDIWFQA